MVKGRESYKRIIDRIIEDFGTGLAGEVLPGERELAEKYSVKRSTIQYALGKLAERGKVYRVRGKGTFFKKDDPGVIDIGAAAVDGTKGIYALVRSYGMNVKSVVLVCGTITGNRFIENKLGLMEDEPVFALHRVRYSNDEPLAVEYTYVPKTLFPDIETIDFSKASLYEYMGARGRLPEKYDKKIRLVKLFPKEARYLELPVDGPAFGFEFIGVDADRQPVEYTESYVRSDRTEFRFSSRI